MVSGKGFYVAEDGKVKDIVDDEEITIIEFEHSKYGQIDYVVYEIDGVESNKVIKWHDSTGFPLPPSDWEDELNE